MVVSYYPLRYSVSSYKVPFLFLLGPDNGSNNSESGVFSILDTRWYGLYSHLLLVTIFLVLIKSYHFFHINFVVLENTPTATINILSGHLCCSYLIFSWELHHLMFLCIWISQYFALNCHQNDLEQRPFSINMEYKFFENHGLIFIRILMLEIINKREYKSELNNFRIWYNYMIKTKGQ